MPHRAQAVCHGMGHRQSNAYRQRKGVAFGRQAALLQGMGPDPTTWSPAVTSRGHSAIPMSASANALFAGGNVWSMRSCWSRNRRILSSHTPSPRVAGKGGTTGRAVDMTLC